MAVQLTNNAYSTLAAAISTTDTSITVAAGEGARFPALQTGNFFNVTLLTTENTLEIVQCTARNGDTMIVTRAQEGTVALPFPAGSKVELRITVANIIGLVGNDDVLAL
jgi:hypothetical protein